MFSAINNKTGQPIQGIDNKSICDLNARVAYTSKVQPACPLPLEKSTSYIFPLTIDTASLGPVRFVFVFKLFYFKIILREFLLIYSSFIFQGDVTLKFRYSNKKGIISSVCAKFNIQAPDTPGLKVIIFIRTYIFLVPYKSITY